jgi:hypothetical protein
MLGAYLCLACSAGHLLGNCVLSRPPLRRHTGIALPVCAALA